MNDAKSVKEFAEKNAGKKFVMNAPDIGAEEPVLVVGYNNDNVLVQKENRGHSTNRGTMVFEVPRKNLWWVLIEHLTPIETPSEPRKHTKKVRKVLDAGKVLQETLVDIKGVYTRVDKKTGKLYTIVELKNGAKAEVTLQDGDKFDPYKAVLYGREKAKLLREKKLKAEKKAAIELLKAEGDRQEVLAEARRLVRHW